jgi:alcohol dehydrogenase (NADP+)
MGFVYKKTSQKVGSYDVLIRTTHSGLCTTDVHAKSKGCGLGHEGVGIVERIGRYVRNLSPGQRVGWGWLHSVSHLCH